MGKYTTYETKFKRGSSKYNGSRVVICNAIEELMKHQLDNIREIDLKIVINEENKESTKSTVVIDSSSTSLISVDGQDPNALCEFISFLKNQIDLDQLMNKTTYEKFRSIFTELYFNAFFNGRRKVKFTLDTDEINEIMNYQKLECMIESQNIEGNLFYKVISSKRKLKRSDWIKQYDEYHKGD